MPRKGGVQLETTSERIACPRSFLLRTFGKEFRMTRTFFGVMIATILSCSLIGCKGKQKPAQTQPPTEETVQPPEGSSGETGGAAEHPQGMENGEAEHTQGSGAKTEDNGGN